MSIDKAKALTASLRSFRSTIEHVDRGQFVSKQLAEHYNGLRERAAGFPTLIEYLPAAIELNNESEVTGATWSTYADLMVYLNQMIELLKLLDEH